MSLSFTIPGAGATGAAGGQAPVAGAGANQAMAFAALRLDRINSAEVIRLARAVYFRFLSQGASRVEPLGVVIVAAGEGGRVVFERPVLLPDEQFVPLDWLQGRPGERNRPMRPPRNPGPRASSG